ncbi:EXS family-domain-containing protein [Hygrophoropsis aurantiaca]|uniref:EXS family-domain-containing protein n=1 Tax=Hygrophoropsis aurantiaca TaxID=72124 RepID=A0ACB8AEV5_9AGAM|nr:EXS family-domain-containing protein [Hygrophoropsis aurantiaca]
MNTTDDVPSAVTFPLPFRVLFMVGMGIIGWATNLHGLQLQSIDAVSALELRPSPYLPLSSPSPSSHSLPVYKPVYRLFTWYTLWCLLAWILYRVATHSNIYLVDIFRYIPAVCSLGVLTALICPFDIFQKRARDAFLSALQRCLFPATDQPVHFADVVFADVLTSFAKVLGDVWLSLCMLLPGGSLLTLPSQENWTQWILPTIMSIPYFIRLRQCLIEHRSPLNSSRRPLFNAVKYATAFPVIFLSAAQRIAVKELVEEKGAEVTRQAWHGEHPLFRLWLLAAAVNSLYSFWWDVTNDWGLDLLRAKSLQSRGGPPLPLVLPSLHSKAASLKESPHPHLPFESLTENTAANTNGHPSSSSPTAFRPRYHRPPAYPYGLRPALLYPLPVYPLIVFFNLVLRLTWSIKLSSHLHSYTEGSALIFWLELAEVLRRWMWVFVRVEWEIVKKRSEGAGGGVGGGVEIELAPPQVGYRDDDGGYAVL